jgi:hypothetical protein
MTRPLAIVDAHHHVWDPDVNYHPWLRDRPVTGFRYGDYSRINRRYLVPDYLADARNWQVAGTVYVEAEWDPTDPVGEMDFIAGLRRASGYPSVAVGQIRLDERGAAPTLERLASHDFVRSVRQKPRANATPRDGTAGGMTDASWREGFPGCESGGCGSICRPRGGISMRQPIWPATFPIRQSSSITPVCRRIAARRGFRPGVKRWRASLIARMSRSRSPASARRGWRGPQRGIGKSC